MKYWNDLDGTIFFSKIFSQPIEIGEILIHTLRLENDQPLFGIGFDIPEFPDRLPEKWKDEGYNTCRIGLTCFEVSNLQIVNLPCKELFSVKIEEEDGYFFFTAKSKSASVELKSKWLTLSGPSAYMNGPEPED
ncbi:hypothetical protein AO391_15785 [Pseudomonas marginalis ICMP 9505]|nr:hypothetical protein AO391_15785 [Pseudomonas marginalis ICMP 9505]